MGHAYVLGERVLFYNKINLDDTYSVRILHVQLKKTNNMPQPNTIPSANTMATEKMPDKIYATPRGTGTVSGIWVDRPIGDEPRGEHAYILAAKVQELFKYVQKLQAESFDGWEQENVAGYLTACTSIEEKIKSLLPKKL